MFNDENDGIANLPVANPFAEGKNSQRLATALADAAGGREIAEVQAALVIAKRFPRDQKSACDRILNTCARPALAELAIYQYSKGGTDVTGPSIRLAEAVAQNWGNMLTGVTEISRGAGASECLAYAWDLETNFRDEKRFHVSHWRDTKKGGYVIKDEREIYELVANMGARRKRACILAVIPKDVIELAQQQCEVTMRTSIEITPDLIKNLLSKFDEFGVSKKQIEARIQRTIDVITPAQIVNLRKVFNSIRDGMSTAQDWFEVEAPTGLDKLAAGVEKAAAGRVAAGKMMAEAKQSAKDAPAPASQAAAPSNRNAEVQISAAGLVARFASHTDIDMLKADAELIDLLPEADQEAAREAYMQRLDVIGRV